MTHFAIESWAVVSCERAHGIGPVLICTVMPLCALAVCGSVWRSGRTQTVLCASRLAANGVGIQFLNSPWIMTHGLQSKVLHVFAHEELGVPVYSHHGELLRVTHVAGGRGSGRAVAALRSRKNGSRKNGGSSSPIAPLNDLCAASNFRVLSELAT